MKNRNSSTTFLKLLNSAAFPVILIVTCMVIVALSTDAKAASQENVFNTSQVDLPVSAIRRCQGPWHYRCHAEDISNPASLTRQPNASRSDYDDEPAFKRCGRLWQYRCRGESSPQTENINFARQEYLINDLQIVDDIEVVKPEGQSADEDESGFQRCGRLWLWHCGGRR